MCGDRSCRTIAREAGGFLQKFVSKNVSKGERSRFARTVAASSFGCGRVCRTGSFLTCAGSSGSWRAVAPPVTRRAFAPGTHAGSALRCRDPNCRLESVAAGLAFPQMSDAAGVNMLRPFRREQMLAALCALDYGAPGARVHVGGAMKFHRASSSLLAQTPCLRANVSRQAPQFLFCWFDASAQSARQ